MACLVGRVPIDLGKRPLRRTWNAPCGSISANPECQHKSKWRFSLDSLVHRSSARHTVLQSLLGHPGLEVICQVVIWALHLLIIQKGIGTVRKFQDWAGPTASRSATAFR